MDLCTADSVILHCSDSVHGCQRVFDDWHRQRGWDGCGYHFIAGNGFPWMRDHNVTLEPLETLIGQIECGRKVFPGIGQVEVGAHCHGLNRRSIGVCLVGRGQYSPAQKASAIQLIQELMLDFHIPVAGVLGHYETDSGRRKGKTCPNIEMDHFRAWL